MSLAIPVALVTEIYLSIIFHKKSYEIKNATLSKDEDVKIRKERRLENMNTPVIFGAHTRKQCWVDESLAWVNAIVVCYQ